MPKADFFTRLGLFAAPDFLSPEECQSLRAEMRTAVRSPATVREQGDDYGVDEEARRTKRAEVSSQAFSLVEERLNELRPQLEEHFETSLSGFQKLGFLVYGEGDYFQRHVDRGPDPDAADFARERRVSAVVFLNDETEEPEPDTYGGGALTFYGLLGDERVGLPLTGEQGLLIAFPSDAIHEVTPVTHGERYTVVTWFVE